MINLNLLKKVAIILPARIGVDSNQTANNNNYPVDDIDGYSANNNHYETADNIIPNSYTGSGGQTSVYKGNIHRPPHSHTNQKNLENIALCFTPRAPTPEVTRQEAALVNMLHLLHVLKPLKSFPNPHGRLRQTADAYVAPLEFIEGGTLLALHQNHPDKFSVEFILDLISQTSQALYDAHNLEVTHHGKRQKLGFVHGDLSLTNIMVTPAGKIKLVDVANADHCLRQHLPEPQATPRYMSFDWIDYMEAIDTKVPDLKFATFVNHSSDIFSLGLILMELLGHPLTISSEDDVLHPFLFTRRKNSQLQLLKQDLQARGMNQKTIKILIELLDSMLLPRDKEERPNGLVVSSTLQKVIATIKTAS